MNNFKHPQYLTPNGFVRSVKKPKLKSLLYATNAGRSADTSDKETSSNKVSAGKDPTATKSKTLSARSNIAVKTTATNTSGKSITPARLRLLAEMRALAKQKQQRRERGISDKAAKAIADALTAMLHSK